MPNKKARFQKHLLTIFFILLVLKFAGCKVQIDSFKERKETSPQSCNSRTEEEIVMEQRLASAWEHARPALVESLSTSLSRQDPSVLYFLQNQTANLLFHAEYVRDIKGLESLASLYEYAFDWLTPHRQALFLYVLQFDGTDVYRSVWPLAREASFWTKPVEGFSVGQEDVLSSSQFLYACARLVRIIAEIPHPSPSLMRFSNRVAPILAEDHYRRWIVADPGVPGSFQVRGWGCNYGTFSHSQRVRHLFYREFGTSSMSKLRDPPPAYCNAVTDTDLWIIAGVLELLSAHAHNPEQVPISESLAVVLADHARLGMTLVESRLSGTALRTSENSAVTGLIFDSGIWDTHPDYQYAGYLANSYQCRDCLAIGKCVCPEFPGWIQPASPIARISPVPAKQIGWDIGHARRFVSVFDSFIRQGQVINHPFPSREVMEKLARQFAFAVFNGNLSDPHFSNYMNGSNGWYRVNYSNRPAFGYPPNSMDKNVNLLGYGFWIEYEPSIKSALKASFEKYDPGNDAQASDAIWLIQTLPQLLPYSAAGAPCSWP